MASKFDDYDYDDTYDPDYDYDIVANKSEKVEKVVVKRQPQRQIQSSAQRKVVGSTSDSHDNNVKSANVKYDKKGRIKKKDSTLAIIADAIIVVTMIIPMPLILILLFCIAAIILAIIDLATLNKEIYRRVGSIVAIVVGGIMFLYALFEYVDRVGGLLG